MLSLHFVGSGDAFGNGGRFQSCISLRTPRQHLLLDCGASSLIALKQQGIDPNGVDGVLVSHLHGDHFGGLPFLILDGQFSRRERAMQVYGPPGTSERLQAAMEVLFPGSSTVQRRFATEVTELTPGDVVILGDLRVTPFEVVHASGAPPLAYRIEHAGRVLAYSGDSEWCDGLAAAAAGADLFICEAYTYERVVKFHPSYAELRDHRAALASTRTVLTHMGPDMLAHRDEVAEECAYDGMTLQL